MRNFHTMPLREAQGWVFFGLRQHEWPTMPARDVEAVEEEAGAWVVPGPRRSVQSEWRSLVQVCMSDPHDLGFFVPRRNADGELHHLVFCGASRKTMIRRLHLWEEAGLIRVLRGEKRTRHAPIVGVQIPKLTEVLSWYFQAVIIAKGRAEMGAVSDEYLLPATFQQIRCALRVFLQGQEYPSGWYRMQLRQVLESAGVEDRRG